MESASAKVLQSLKDPSIPETPPQRDCESKAFTLFELLVVTTAMVLLGLVACPLWVREKQKKDRTACIANLKTLGVAYESWLNDFHDRLPWQVSGSDGGTSGRQTAYKHYQILSNYLKDPKVLVCPGLKGYRSPSLNMAMLGDSNLSYAIGIDASMNPPSEGCSRSGPMPWVAADFDFASKDSPKRPFGICSEAGDIRVERIAGKYGQEESFNIAWSGNNNHNYSDKPFKIGCALTFDGAVVMLDDLGLSREMSIFRQDEQGAAHILKPGP